MTKPAVEDYPAIRAAMKERGLEASIPMYCAFCRDTGWQDVALGFMTPIYEECANCFNPKGKAKP